MTDTLSWLCSPSMTACMAYIRTCANRAATGAGIQFYSSNHRNLSLPQWMRWDGQYRNLQRYTHARNQSGHWEMQHTTYTLQSLAYKLKEYTPYGHLRTMCAHTAVNHFLSEYTPFQHVGSAVLRRLPTAFYSWKCGNPNRPAVQSHPPLTPGDSSGLREWSVKRTARDTLSGVANEDVSMATLRRRGPVTRWEHLIGWPEVHTTLVHLTHTGQGRSM